MDHPVLMRNLFIHWRQYGACTTRGALQPQCGTAQLSHIIADFKLSSCNACWYFGSGVLHGVQVNLVDDVSGTTVGHIFTGYGAVKI
jgi:hypothetical protein